MSVRDDDVRVRVALAEEAAAPLRRLAALSGAEPPTGLVAIAELDGEPVAVIPFGGGAAIADPERAGPGVLTLLRVHLWAFRGIAAVWGC